MKLLLDTHIWLWSLLDRQRLTRNVVRVLEDEGNELWLSPISSWEIVVLCQKKRLALDPNPRAWITHNLTIAPMREAPVTHDVALEMARIQLPHRDPADHFLVATAKVFELTLVTADEHLLKAQNISVLANR